MKRWLVLLMLLIQAVFAVGAEAAIQVPPKPSVSSGIYVQDYAGVLSPQTRQALNAIGQDLDNKTTAQVAVVTVKTLDGQPIDEYGLTLLRQWGLGNKEKNNGALILVAVDDRQSRIEVGYGLEGVLPDGLTGRIQDQQMLPYFKQGQYEKGIVQGYLTVATTVAKSYDVKLEGVRYNGGAQQGTGDTPMPGWMKALIAVGLIVLVIVDHMFFGGIITQFILLALLRGGGRTVCAAGSHRSHSPARGCRCETGRRRGASAAAVRWCSPAASTRPRPGSGTRWRAAKASTFPRR